jgi:hypothetical protein
MKRAVKELLGVFLAAGGWRSARCDKFEVLEVGDIKCTTNALESASDPFWFEEKNHIPLRCSPSSVNRGVLNLEEFRTQPKFV